MTYVTPPLADVLADPAALKEIQELLNNSDRWSPDTLEGIAEIMRRAGYEID